MGNPVIIGSLRTPIGSFLGSLSAFRASELGSFVIKELVKRTQINKDDIDEVIMGNVLQAGNGQNPARQAAIYAGLDPKTPCLTINKVCGSGLKAVMLAAQAIKAGDAKLIVAGGMESMSNCPYLLPKARTGYRLGDGKIVDSMVHDGLWDIYNDFHMGITGELVSEKYSISREEQDEYSAKSQQKASNAVKSGLFDKEVMSVEIPQRKKDPIIFNKDEGPREGVTKEKLSKLRAAFKKDGTVTAGNASTINDGASAVMVADEEYAKANGLPIIAKIVSYTVSGVEPKWVMLAPIYAIRMLFEKTGWNEDSTDLFELNEAFAVQSIAALRDLNLNADKVNVKGGAIALGHPIGASGARVLTTLLHAMDDNNSAKGIAALCLGGGNAVAMAVEKV